MAEWSKFTSDTLGSIARLKFWYSKEDVGSNPASHILLLTSVFCNFAISYMIILNVRVQLIIFTNIWNDGQKTNKYTFLIAQARNTCQMLLFCASMDNTNMKKLQTEPLG